MAASYGSSIVKLVSETVRGWDARTVTARLEAAVGRDLQYIRINGTLVGGLVGLVLHVLDSAVSDERLDALAESARNRGLKLVRSRVRTPGKRRFGKVGLTDAGAKPVFGMDDKGPIAKPEEVEDYLRNLGAKDWGASLDVAVLPRKRKPKAAREPRTTASPRQAPKPQAKARPNPSRSRSPSRRFATPSPAMPRALVELITLLGHEIDEKSVRKNLDALDEGERAAAGRNARQEGRRALSASTGW